MREVVVELAETYGTDMSEWLGAKQKAVKLARDLTSSVNFFGVNEKEYAAEICEYPFALLNFREIVYAWLAMCKVIPESWTDARNERSVRIMKEVALIMEENGLEIPNIPNHYVFVRYGEFPEDAIKNGLTNEQAFACAVALQIAREHKTLQQSLAGVAMEFLKRLPDFPEALVRERLGDYWDQFPMI